MAEDKTLKCVAVGDGAVGKTCLLISYTTSSFPEEYVPTVFDNYTTAIDVDDQKYTLNLWDTAGEEDYDRQRPLSYPGTDVFLLCFALSSQASFDNITSKWCREVTLYCPKAAVVLVGLKSDLKQDEQTIASMQQTGRKFVSDDEIQHTASKINAIYVECSAKTQDRLNEVFEEAVRAAVAKMDQ